jgi:proteasome alpha subunit
MQPMQHQMMGYDRAITMFSPDGRLLQVEYAKKTVKQGSTAIGLVCKDGVLLVSDRRIVDKLVVAESVEKIWEIDSHIGATASGIISDARVLIEHGQVKAQQHKVSYDSPVDTLSIVRSICALKQICTQSGGLRPFGVSVIAGGVDITGPKLYVTDPTGIYFQYKAAVIGENDEEIEEILIKDYKEKMTLAEGLKLCMKSLKKVLDGEFDIKRIDAAYVNTEDKKFTKYTKAEIENVFKTK